MTLERRDLAVDPEALAGFAALTAGAAALGVSVTRNPRNKLWYRLIRKPPQTPPDRTFALVWPVLYGLIAYSGARSWRHREDRGGGTALALWGAQMVFNALWTPLFFGRVGGKHRPKTAMVDLLATLGSLVAYTGVVAKRDRPAAWAMAPYLVWLTFAATLNAGIVRRNPG